LAVLFTLAPDARAEEPCVHEQGVQSVVIRRTIPYPRSVDRGPLTSDRLSTTSTRYIDARRGYRPYASVDGDGYGTCFEVTVGYDDHFGISRPEDRPYSYAHRAPRTGVTQYQSSAPASTANDTQMLRINPAATDVIQADEPERVAVDMTVRVHNDRSALPTTHGAVIIRSDGTVIQVGD